MKNRPFIFGFTILAILAAAFGVYRYMHSGWARYTDTNLGFLFEYPAGEMLPEPEGASGSTTIAIDNRIKPDGTNLSRAKSIVVSAYPADASITSLDDFVAWYLARAKNSPAGNLSFPNEGYHTLDGQKVAVEQLINGGGEPLPNTSRSTEVFFFYRGQAWILTMTNLAQTDVERILSSFRFLGSK